eukprot:3795123-Pyramimonas_sp.AAC.1
MPDCSPPSSSSSSNPPIGRVRACSANRAWSQTNGPRRSNRTPAVLNAQPEAVFLAASPHSTTRRAADVQRAASRGG